MSIYVTNNRWSGQGCSLILGCLLSVVLLPCFSQNLVPNPSFEESDTCQLGLGFRFPEQGPHHWFSSWGTPDHLQSCLPYGAANGIPFNAWTFQEPLEGESCVGMFTYHQNGLDQQREWVVVELLEPLEVGQTYYGSFYANAGFGGNLQNPQVWLGSGNASMLFTMQAAQWDFSSPNPTYPNRAHIIRPDILADTVTWTLVSGSFVADSAYRFVMLGNFFSNALTDTMHFADPNSVFWWAPRGYTLFDQVCVSAAPDGCDMANGVEQEVTGEVMLFPNPAAGELWIRGAKGSMGLIHDAIGRIVWEGWFTEEALRLDVSTWARGMFALRLQGIGGYRSFKFVLVG